MCWFTVFFFPKIHNTNEKTPFQAPSHSVLRVKTLVWMETCVKIFQSKIWVRKDKEERRRAAELTYVSWCATSSGHDVSGALHLRETEVADHDLGLVLGIKIQQILWLNAKKRGRRTEFHPEQQIEYIKRS